MSDEEIDILVVGAGNAALTGALSAAESGLNVTVLEKASREERGGNTVFTGGVFRHAHNGKPDIKKLLDGISKEEWDETEIGEFPPQALYDEVMKITGGKADPVLTRRWAEASLDTVLWMKNNLGVKFTFNDVFTLKELGGKKYRGPGVLMSEEKGVGLSRTLFAKCDELDNVSIRYDTQVTGLDLDSNRVKGVSVKLNGSTEHISASAVILGSGGFESSKELREKYMGSSLSRAKVRGTRHNTGETLVAAMDIGAEVNGDFSDCHATQIDARSPDYGKIELTDKTSRYSWMFGILVNKNAERFVDEGEDFGDLLYAKLGKTILKEPGSVAYQIFDEKTVPLLEKRYSSIPPIKAGSIDEIASKVDVNLPNLKKTVEEFNEHVTGVGTFNPGIKDGLGTKGLKLEKTNWAQKLDSLPYTVYPVTGGITFTFGGLKVDTEAKVINKQGSPIEGLYAAGEITGGFFYNNYPGGAGLVRGAVFGKISGLEAAKYVKGR